jgi:hypothetical protein
LKKVLFSILIGIILFVGCNESSTIGGDLVIEEDFALGFTDTLSVKAKTVRSAPIPTYYTINFLFNTFMVGELDDPIFGKSKSTLYLDMQLAGFPNFSGGELDSMVLILGLNENGFYGDSTSLFDLEVWELSERLDNQDTIYSDKSFQRLDGPLQMPIASAYSLFVNKIDSTRITSYITDEEISLSPQIRMRINDRWALGLFNDSIANQDNDELIERVNGFQITAIPDNGNSMIGLDLQEFSQVSGVDVYYVNSLGSKNVYRYIFSERRHQHFESMTQNAEVDNYLDKDISDGGPLFVQGMAGVVTEIDLSSVKQLDAELLNLAELEVFLYDDFSENDTTLYPPARSFALINNTTGQEIDDLAFG